jgi:hypothetical protein
MRCVYCSLFRSRGNAARGTIPESPESGDIRIFLDGVMGLGVATVRIWSSPRPLDERADDEQVYGDDGG